MTTETPSVEAHVHDWSETLQSRETKYYYVAGASHMWMSD